MACGAIFLLHYCNKVVLLCDWRVRFCTGMLFICTLHVLELPVGYILMKRSILYSKTALIKVFICELSMKFTNNISDSTSMYRFHAYAVLADKCLDICIQENTRDLTFGLNQTMNFIRVHV